MCSDYHRLIAPLHRGPCVPPTELVRDAVFRFTRQCQIVAGAVIPPINATEVVATACASVRAFPVPLPEDLTPCCVALLAAVGRRIEKCRTVSSAITEQSLGGTDAELRRAFGILLLHYSDAAISLSKISLVFGISEARLSTWYRTAGYRFSEYLSALRVLTAAAKLTETSAAISHVAITAGYHHGGELDRDFAKLLHISPRRFRAAHAMIISNSDFTPKWPFHSTPIMQVPCSA
ncbi:MAG: hypothetical protein DMF84_09255 [Acidobacteria bacterium]|nr:MAG: hypothetical protein DMF84_09255 [Acidobacteriota bacterium]